MVQELLNRGWLPLLLRWLGLAHRPNLQIEALSALTTVAQTTTEHTPLLLKVRNFELKYGSGKASLFSAYAALLCSALFSVKLKNDGRTQHVLG